MQQCTGGKDCKRKELNWVLMHIKYSIDCSSDGVCGGMRWEWGECGGGIKGGDSACMREGEGRIKT